MGGGAGGGGGRMSPNDRQWADPSPTKHGMERAGLQGGLDAKLAQPGGKTPAKESLRRAKAVYGAAVKSSSPRYSPNGALTVGPPYTLHQEITLVRGNTSGM